MSYILYTKSQNFFQKNGKLILSDLKNQIGKDTTRTQITINDDDYKINNSENMVNATIQQKADYFNLTLIEYLKKMSKKIDYNLINKIGILNIQNILNLIVDIITVEIMNKIAPETCVFLNTKIHSEITLNQNKKTCKRFYSSDIIISYNQELDPEYNCGKIEFILSVDFYENTYEFEKFVLNYNVNKCDPNYEEKQSRLQMPKMQMPKMQIPELNDNVLVPFAVTGGIVAAPFILGVLGGKKTKKRRKLELNKDKK